MAKFEKSVFKIKIKFYVVLVKIISIILFGAICLKSKKISNKTIMIEKLKLNKGTLYIIINRSVNIQPGLQNSINNILKKKGIKKNVFLTEDKQYLCIGPFEKKIEAEKFMNILTSYHINSSIDQAI